MSTFIHWEQSDGRSPTLAVKDVIDIAGLPTTAGSRLIADLCVSATADASCVTLARNAGVRFVGKTNLVELALGAHGINPWFGTPVNPLGSDLAPGGSSSGSAVAVACGDADVALGTDTGGSIRIPSACCGVVGLKPTWGRLSMDGIMPLSPSLDTVGPMSATVEGVIMGMHWLEPGFRISQELPDRVALTVNGVRDPAIPAAIYQLLRSAGLEVEKIYIPDWGAAWRAGSNILQSEAAQSHRSLVSVLHRLDPDVAERLRSGAQCSAACLQEAQLVRRAWVRRMQRIFDTADLLVLPTIPSFPPKLEAARKSSLNWFTLPVNLAGLPALSLPVPCASSVPTSLQIVGPAGSEERLLALGLHLERLRSA